MPVCRFHGALRPETVRRGVDHPQYKHGWRSQAGIEEYRQASARLRELEDYVIEAGLMTGGRTRGRTPG